MTYYVYIRQEEERFVAEVPALPGCRTFGRSEQEALENIRAVVEVYRIQLQRSRQPLPQVKVVRLS